MTQALVSLKEKVEAGEILTAKQFEDVLGMDGVKTRLGYSKGMCAWQAYTESIDAAAELHEALLPGWDIYICTYEDDSFEASVAPAPTAIEFGAVNQSMSRAWLLAILAALIAKEQEDG